MNETKRVHSIARKIGSSWTLRAIGLVLRLNLLILLLAALGFMYFFEKSALEDAWQPNLERRVELTSPSDPLSAEYRVMSPDGEWHVQPLRPVLEAALPFAATLGIIEILVVIGESTRAHRKARKLLEPLDKIARNMQAVSRQQNEGAHYEDRLRDLESAIQNISPTHPGERLSTGAQELNGLENAINDLLVRMRESYRQQSQFVSDASHELRTPIAVIQGYANMLARWGKDDAQVLEESIAAIQSESDYMKKLVEELLFLARGEIGRNPFEPAQLSLTELLRDVCDESAMIDPDHSWAFSGDAEISVTADSGMLKQCARVLCENARKYTPSGEQILISVSEDAQWARFSVQDEGIGIDRDDVSRVFDRFYRSDPARDRNSGGSGLGLSIAKWIVDRHGGYFDVLSVKDVGTRFTVSLPKQNSPS